MEKDEKFEAAFKQAVEATKREQEAAPDTADLTRLIFLGVYAFLKALDVVKPER